jgi:ribosomal protein S18 acetylase RimI-like enzyme
MKVDMPPMMVRAYDDRDLLRVGEIHALSRQATYVDLVPPDALARMTPSSQTAVWRGRIGRAVAAFVVTPADGRDDRPVGFAVVVETARGTELNAIHVLPDELGSGAGQALMDAVVTELRARGVADAHLFVVDGNERAQRFYRRNGWHLRGPAGRHDIGGAVVPILEYGLDLTCRPSTKG